MKTFFEEYGLAIIIAVVILLLIVMASPVGGSIKNSLLDAKESTEYINNDVSNKAQDSINQLAGKESDVVTVTLTGKTVISLNKGNKYKLPKSDTRLGFINANNNNEVYRDGEVITVNNNMEFTAIDSYLLRHSGTAVRKRGQTGGRGLAFAAQVKINDGPPIHSQGFTYGCVIVTSEQYYESIKDNFSIHATSAPNYYNIVFGASDFVTSDPTQYITGITNMQTKNFGKEYGAIPYIIINYKNGGEATVHYLSPKFKSASQVAKNLLAQHPEYSQADKDWYQGYVVD